MPEWKQMTPAMVEPMRDMMTEMEETVDNMTMEQLMEDPVWPATVSMAAVALIPKAANRASCTICGRAHASLKLSDGANLACPNQQREASQKIAFRNVFGLCCWQWNERRKELPRRQSTRPNSST